MMKIKHGLFIVFACLLAAGCNGDMRTDGGDTTKGRDAELVQPPTLENQLENRHPPIKLRGTVKSLHVSDNGRIAVFCDSVWYDGDDATIPRELRVFNCNDGRLLWSSDLSDMFVGVDECVFEAGSQRVLVFGSDVLLCEEGKPPTILAVNDSLRSDFWLTHLNAVASKLRGESEVPQAVINKTLQEYLNCYYLGTPVSVARPDSVDLKAQEAVRATAAAVLPATRSLLLEGGPKREGNNFAPSRRFGTSLTVWGTPAIIMSCGRNQACLYDNQSLRAIWLINAATEGFDQPAARNFLDPRLLNHLKSPAEGRGSRPTTWSVTERGDKLFFSVLSYNQADYVGRRVHSVVVARHDLKTGLQDRWQAFHTVDAIGMATNGERVAVLHSDGHAAIWDISGAPPNPRLLWQERLLAPATSIRLGQTPVATGIHVVMREGVTAFSIGDQMWYVRENKLSGPYNFPERSVEVEQESTQPGDIRPPPGTITALEVTDKVVAVGNRSGDVWFVPVHTVQE